MVDVNQIEKLIDSRFERFGVNQRRETVRLVFEVSKREECLPDQVLLDCPQDDSSFKNIKKYLLERRYPNLIQSPSSLKPYIGELNINLDLKADLKQNPFQYQNFYIEEEVSSSNFVVRLKEKFSNAEFHVISSYKGFHRERKMGISDYNRRGKEIFIIKENFDFFKQCPCSFKSVHCGLYVVNLGSGCLFECEYCYLQDYINSPGIVLPSNLEDFFDEFKKLNKDIRVGSGEITDSLVFDHITEYSSQIVEFFQDYPKSTFEFKTKSNAIDRLLDVKPANNIVVAWSMNPQIIIENIEHFTASLDERLEAAQKCVAAGYKVGFHFDPLIYFEGWEDQYHALVKKIFTTIPSDRIAAVSLGTLRMTPRLKKVIENRFPENKILNEEFSMSYDGKLRYGFQQRVDLYQKMKNWIQEFAPNVFLYLCMEEKDACGSCEAAPLKEYGRH